MSNPAHELADLLELWRAGEGRSPMLARSPARDSRKIVESEVIHESLRGVRLLNEVLVGIDAMEARGREVSHYRALIPELFKAVFCPDVSWSSNNNNRGNNLSQPSLHALRMAADAMEGLLPSGPSQPAVGRIVDALTEALTIVGELPDDLDTAQLRWQIGQAIYFAQQVETVGSQAVAAAATQAADGMVRRSESDDVSPEQRIGLREAARSILFGAAGGSMGDGLTAIAEQAPRLFALLAGGS